MTNIKKLEDVIKKSGLKKGFLAESIGLSRQAFSKKCKNESLFTSEEIKGLCELLNITKLSEKEQIFFAK